MTESGSGWVPLPGDSTCREDANTRRWGGPLPRRDGTEGGHAPLAGGARILPADVVDAPATRHPSPQVPPNAWWDRGDCYPVRVTDVAPRETFLLSHCSAAECTLEPQTHGILRHRDSEDYP